MSFKRKNQSTDRRTRYTQNSICDSLLSLMQRKPFTKITVTEICRQSEINRGTFYLHYYDLDDVLDDVIEKTIQDTTQVFDHVMCPEKDRCTYPFCRKVQESQEFRILFSDETASVRLLDKLCELSKENFITKLMQNSILSYEQAEAILYFQMTGCLAINKRMIKNNCRDWQNIQHTIDQFIKAGIENFLIRDQREELM
ncbi:MAG: TetR/AcrR family transcriptional regulator [Ruminococcus sp.]